MAREGEGMLETEEDIKQHILAHINDGEYRLAETMLKKLIEKVENDD